MVRDNLRQGGSLILVSFSNLFLGQAKEKHLTNALEELYNS